MQDIINNPEYWVLLSFLIFVGLLLYMGVPGLMAKGLDDRAERIRHELDEARRLREEAQALLTEYQKKAREAEDEAKGIIDQARKDAEVMEKETEVKLQESLARRTKLAEEKIARAEAQAVSEVKASAIDAAVAASEKIVSSKVSGDKAGNLIEQSIKSLGNRLN
ncbi:MAG: F0F1 ATP synthase subunit B [Alphaproteobacteria bacterium]|nr:F0F1 ATP synthase subunit B [Alphaproteobacteria bacterium]